MLFISKLKLTYCLQSTIYYVCNINWHALILCIMLYLLILDFIFLLVPMVHNCHLIATEPNYESSLWFVSVIKEKKITVAFAFYQILNIYSTPLLCSSSHSSYSLSPRGRHHQVTSSLEPQVWRIRYIFLHWDRNR